MVRLGSIATTLAISEKGMASFTEALERASETMKRFARQQREIHIEIHRAEWWKRGEAEPDYIYDRNKAEWWEREDPPPPFECAA